MENRKEDSSKKSKQTTKKCEIQDPLGDFLRDIAYELEQKEKEREKRRKSI